MHASWLRLAGKVLASNFDRLRRPYKLTYVVTKECHSRCVNCDIWRIAPRNELTLDEAEKLATNSPFLSWVDFTGGEPTDRPDFVEVVEAFLRRCPELLLIHFPTNGLRPDRITACAERIARLRPPRLVVSVSIDGPPQHNDRLRGVPGDFRNAATTYRQLSKLPGVEAFVGMTLYPENMSMVDQTVQAIRELVPEFSYRKLHVNLPHISGHYYQNDALPPRLNADMIRTVDDLMTRRGLPRHPFEWVERMYHRKVKDYVNTHRCPVRCASLMASCYLAEDGTVYPCSIWNAPLGNIRDHGYSLVPLLEHDTATRRRQEIAAGSCPHCWTPCEAYQSLAANLLPLRSHR